MTTATNFRFQTNAGATVDLRELPFAYESLTAEVGRRPVGFRFSKQIINIRARFHGRTIIACGESEDSETARAKALSELVERTALLQSGESLGCETSNGWAAHPDRQQSRLNSIFEIVERDAVLSHWYASAPFLEIRIDELPRSIRNWSREELSRSEFPSLRILLSTTGLGPSVTCLFVDARGMGVSAHGTRLTLKDSIEAAIAEACRAAHSALRREHWSDTLRLKNKSASRVDPGAHAVYYAYHTAFPKWMFGDAIGWAEAAAIWSCRARQLMTNPTEFTYQSALASPLHVGFARHPLAFELRWNNTDVKEVSTSVAAARIHLNLDNVNQNPHIVS